MRLAESSHHEFFFFFVTFSCEVQVVAGYRIPGKGYRGVTVAANYRGSVTVQMPLLLVTVRRKPWWLITAEA